MAITHAPVGPHEDDDHSESHEQQPPQQPQPMHPSQVLHPRTFSNASTASLDIEAWTVAALESLSIAPIAQGTGRALSIPIDGTHGNGNGNGTPDAAAQMKLRGVVFDDAATYGASITPPRRPPSRRDSMKRREELLKGKEGSRQRRRWENDRLLHVPNPSDWQIRPTHRVLPPVPYQLAQFWDKGLREHHLRHHRAHHKPQPTSAAAAESAGGVGHVPRDLRATAKRTPAVKAWLRMLEEPVRARWLTHSVSDYYGLDSKSAMVGNPAKRVVYVGAKQKQAGPRRKPPSTPVLPPPLWEMF
ncbi:hypothetical protein N0V88_006943 [Collariella sp. IMI 366227]|nr:hypothetical protein N0V88_006943 [Collariella sp. IMI 366227]